MHPALSESYELPFDLYPSVFDWFFQLEEFDHWIQEDRLWQLRCVGSPGSGKTTLSALVAARLREKCQGRNEVVASVFLKEDVDHSEENGFCEDLLDNIYYQLSIKCQEADDLAARLYETYKQARDNGRRRSRQLLRKALSKRLASLQRAFLVLDDIDRCYESSALEVELSRLQTHGLKIMTTSRVPHNASILSVSCDTGAHDEECGPRRVTTYWWCQRCKDENDIICHTCKEGGHVCRTCGHGFFLTEPYHHIDVTISIPDDAILSAFIAHALESVHGDLDLRSTAPDKPPLSPLGALMRKRDGGAYPQKLVHAIAQKAESNIGFARLLVELVHDAGSVEDIEAGAGGAGDRLPKRVVDFFDAGVRKIQARGDAAERELGLKAISVAVDCEDCGFKTFEEVKGELEEAGKKDGLAVLAKGLVVDDLIRAANGMLVQLKGEERQVAAYHTYFGYYVRENYNAALFWEHSMMGRHHGRKQSRTAEFAGMGKTNTVGAGKLLKMRKHIKAVSKLLKNKREKVNIKEYRGFKLKRRITGVF